MILADARIQRLRRLETGDYTLVASQFVQDQTALTPIALAILDDRGWWGNSDLGSTIRELMRGLPLADPSEALRAVTLQALVPLVRFLALAPGRRSAISVRPPGCSG
jgi:phage gp46-like protein